MLAATPYPLARAAEDLRLIRMNLSITDVQYFLAVVRHGHFGRAATECGVTQPAITKGLRRLEDSVGVPLFERGAHGARLTSEGYLFLESARRYQLEHEVLERTALELRAHYAGLLRLGLTNPAGNSPPVRALAELIRRRPGVRVRLTLGKSDVLNSAVEAGELDMAVVPSYPGTPFSCEQLTFGDDHSRVAARVGHPIFQVATPTLASLAPYAWATASTQSVARKLIVGEFTRAGLPPPQVAVEAEYTSEALMGLLAATDLVALVPTAALKNWAGRVEVVNVRELAVSRDLVLLTRPGAHWSPLMHDLRELLVAWENP